MGFEIPLDSDYIDHPKTQHLVKLIGPEADIYPIRLWMWASKYARDGVVKAGWRGVEAACRWSGRPKRLTTALVKSGFLKTDGSTIHDWMEGVGRAISLYEKKKQKQREKYRISVGILPNDPPNSSGRQTEDHQTSSPNPSDPDNPSDPEDPDNPPTGGALRSGGTAEELADAYLRINKGAFVKRAKLVKNIKDRLDAGMSAEAAHARLMDEKACKSMAIWDILDPITPNGEPKPETMKEYRDRRDLKKEVDAKFGGKDAQI